MTTTLHKYAQYMKKVPRKPFTVDDLGGGDAKWAIMAMHQKGLIRKAGTTRKPAGGGRSGRKINRWVATPRFWSQARYWKGS